MGNGVGFSVKEVVETARKVTGHPIPAKEILGWKSQFDDLETIISTAWKWHQSHPNGYKMM